MFLLCKLGTNLRQLDLRSDFTRTESYMPTTFSTADRLRYILILGFWALGPRLISAAEATIYFVTVDASIISNQWSTDLEESYAPHHIGNAGERFKVILTQINVASNL